MKFNDINDILDLIEHNAKLSIEEISSELNFSSDDVVSLIADLELKKVICGYNTIINWDKITGEKCNALIEVKVIPQRGTGFDKIAACISCLEEVDSIYLMSGGYDFIVVVNGKSMKEVSSFVFNKLATIDYVSSTTTHFVLKKYKDYGFQFQGEFEDMETNEILWKISHLKKTRIIRSYILQLFYN